MKPLSLHSVELRISEPAPAGQPVVSTPICLPAAGWASGPASRPLVAGMSRGLGFALFALTLLPFTCLQAALFMDPGTGSLANAAPTVVPGYPNARQAVGQHPPGIYEAGQLQDQLVFVRVAEDLTTYSELLQRRRAGAALASADELLAAEVGSEVPAGELTGNGPEMPIHGFTVCGASLGSRIAAPAVHGCPCGASDPAAPRPGDDLCIHLSPSDVAAFSAAVLWLHGHGDAVTQANVNKYFGYSTTPNCPNGFNPSRVPPSLGPNAGRSPSVPSSGSSGRQSLSAQSPQAGVAASRLSPAAASQPGQHSVSGAATVPGQVLPARQPGALSGVTGRQPKNR